MEIVVASGKGGTGKTTVSAFLVEAFHKAGFSVTAVDADVEAPDLDVALGGITVEEREGIFDSEVAEIDYDLCDNCGECYKACPFLAIEVSDGRVEVNRYFCEGCGLCAIVCPRKAIKMRTVKTGEILIGRTRYGKLVTGYLEIGRRHSGKLVETMRDHARKFGSDIIVIDAAAGTGCPVISSITGADFLVLVVEPSEQALVGARKVIEVARTFRAGVGLVINKWDMNAELSEKIPKILGEDIAYLGRVPFDRAVFEAYARMIPLQDFAPDSPAVKALRGVFERLREVLGL